MVRKRTRASPIASGNISHKRAGRLFRLIYLLAANGRSRPDLLKRLRLDLRGFYRDLERLRELGVEIAVQGRHYRLVGSLAQATAALPFPNPLLNLREAILLARGRTAAHKKLRMQIKKITGQRVILLTPS